MDMHYSFIIPVFNRPDEVFNLLESIAALQGDISHDVVVIEDGSTLKCDTVCNRFRESVPIAYHFKPNSGPGDSRNYGMRMASGNYFIILDSDCIVPPDYLIAVDSALIKEFVHCYGGPDAAHERFSNLQKAINYSMTSFLTTGGIRGGKIQLDRFQPRSFNMGISKEAFERSGGFGRIHPGEDPDLTMRLWDLGYRTSLIPDAFVYHERRISWQLFYKQVNKFGMVRVILIKWHRGSSRLSYWFPTIFTLGIIAALIMALLGFPYLLYLYSLYTLLLIIQSAFQNGLVVGLLSAVAAWIQFTSYGWGFFKSWFTIRVLNKIEHNAFPVLFFRNKEEA